MSEKSFRSYKYFPKFFQTYGPEKVLAISPTDNMRFSRVVGPEKVSLINNIKFDRIIPQTGKPEHNSIADLLPENSPFVLLGSFRRQEEEMILNAVAKLLTLRPDITIGLFPKHIERADHLIKMLRKLNITAGKRSTIIARRLPGAVIVWDVFGELAGAYALAKAAFVGGTLLNLGGQNFLEPLAFGLRPIIGPYWQAFAWVGRDIIAAGLVIEIANENELVAKILSFLDAPLTKERVLQQVEVFFRPRVGGTLAVCRRLIARLEELDKK